VGVEKDNEDRVLVRPEWVRRMEKMVIREGDLKEKRIYMLEGELRIEVIRLHHNIVIGGYGRR